MKIGSIGQDVRQWQVFLVGQEHLLGRVDGIFGKMTHDATIEFQNIHGLDADGIVGPKTLKSAFDKGYELFRPVVSTSSVTRTLSYADKQRLFGPLTYVGNPEPGNPEAIKITNSWTRNLQRVEIPQLAGITGAPKNCTILFHSKGAIRLQQLWIEWEKDGLLHLVKSWSGAWAPRFIRGSKSYLSSHAFATAFDINSRWNSLGVNPPPSGSLGSVRELVPKANELGFFWGGNFPTRPDGMHFELVVST